METVALGRSGRRTSRLGFGCSSVMGSLGRRESLRMLEAAWDAGVRHFDVAPMYGYGEAESCLGEFRSRHGNAVTLTTKFGLVAGQTGAVARAGRAVAREVFRRAPGLKARLRRDAGGEATFVLRRPETPEGGLRPRNPRFNVEEARQSLETSLRALRTERIDVWLLHDAGVADAAEEALLRFLEDAVEAGRVGTFGVGTDRAEIPLLVAERRAFCDVLQFAWSVLDGVEAMPGVFRMHHRALTEDFRGLRGLVLRDGALAARWSEAVGMDLREDGVLARLMLKAALELHPESVILFSSKSPGHIAENVRTAEDGSLAAPARALYRVVQAELEGSTQG